MRQPFVYKQVLNKARIFTILLCLFIGVFPAFSAIHPEENSKIAGQSGKITVSFDGSSDKEILIIMDAHCNEQAQRNIASMLKRYSNNANGKIIAYEGACGEINVNDIKSFPDNNSLSNISGYFLKKGKINGVEYFNILSDSQAKTPLIVGAETPKAYLDNYKAYIDFQSNLKEAKDISAKLLNHGYELAGGILTGPQMDFVRAQLAMHDKEISFIQFCGYLFDLTKNNGIVLAKYPELMKLKKSMEINKKIDSLRVEIERKQLSGLIKQNYPESSIETLYNSLKKGETSPPEYYKTMEQEATRLNIGLTGFKNLTEYTAFLKESDKISNASLLTESIGFANDLANSIFNSSKQKNMYLTLSRLRLLSKMLSLDLSANEYKIVSDEINNYKSKELSNGFGNQDENPLLNKSLASKVDIYINQAMFFYSSALKRNNVIVNNILADMDIEECRKACVIVGGFHVDGISAILRKKGIPHTVISPNMNGDNQLETYYARLSGEKSPFDKAMEESIRQINTQNRNSLPVNSHLAIASLLSSGSLTGNPDEIQSFRAEYKTLMFVDAVYAIEKKGKATIANLKKQIEDILISAWGKSNFTALDDFKLYRDITGKLIIEVQIGNTHYTFFAYDENRAKGIFDDIGQNDNLITKFDIGGLNVAVLPNSALNTVAETKLADDLLGALNQSTMDMKTLESQLNTTANSLNGIITKLIASGYAKNTNSVLSMPDETKEIYRLASKLHRDKQITKDDIRTLPKILQQGFGSMFISNGIIGDDVPLFVVFDFLMSLGNSKKTMFSIYPNHPVIFTFFDEEKLFSAELSRDKNQTGGYTVELLSSDYSEKPFDEETRNEKLKSIYNTPEIINEILNQKKAADDFINLSAKKTDIQPVFALSAETESSNEVLKKLFNYIGDPLTFDEKPKALVFDLDGTLSERDWEKGFLPMPDEIAQSIKQAIANGIKIALVTGQKHSVAEERFLRFFTKEERKMITIYSESGSIATGYDENGYEVNYYSSSFAQSIPGFNKQLFLDKLNQIAKDIALKEYKITINQAQITITFNEKLSPMREKYLEAVSQYTKSLNLPLKVNLAGIHSLDISLNDKSLAVTHFLTNISNAQPEDVMFFGDAYNGNDAPMAKASPHSAHFHVGFDRDKNHIPHNVTILDGKGPHTTSAILKQLMFLIDLTVKGKVNDLAAKSIISNSNIYFDFMKKHSKLTPVDGLKDALILPVWYSTNESKWEEAIPEISKGKFNGVFIGVGASDVSLSYIASAKPETAIIADINPLIPQLFIPIRNALIEFSANRIEYLSMLSGKPVKLDTEGGKKYYLSQSNDKISENATLEEINNFFNKIEFSGKYSQNIFNIILKLLPSELIGPAQEFWKHNIEAFPHNGFHRIDKTLPTLIDAEKRANFPVAWLSNEDNFKFVKDFVTKGKLFGIEANWYNEEMYDLGSFLTANGNNVDLVYLSNVHHKARLSPKPDISNPFLNYYSNLSSLPQTSNTLILSDQPFEVNPYDAVSSFYGSKYEDNLLWFLNSYLKETPIVDFTPSATKEINQSRAVMYSDIIIDTLNKLDRNDLAMLYKGSDLSLRKEMLSQYAKALIENWAQLRDKIRANDKLTPDEHGLAMELNIVFGYGLKDMETVISRFKEPYDFFMQLLSLPYGTGKALLPRTVVEIKSALPKTIALYAKEPDIILIDMDMIISDANSQNMALGKTIDKFRDEHIKRQGRIPLFAVVDFQSNDVIESKRKIDKTLYTRGDNSAMIDYIIVLPYSDIVQSNKTAYDGILNQIGKVNLEKSAKTALKQKGVLSPTQKEIDDYVRQTVITVYKQRSLKNEVKKSFGIEESGFTSRISVISVATNDTLRNFAKNTGASLRLWQDTPKTVGEPLKEGVFMIDILRSIGNEQLPKNLVVKSVNTDIPLTDKEISLNFDIILSLFKDVLKIYEPLSNDKKPQYSLFLTALAKARVNGVITTDKEAFLIPQKNLESLFARQLKDKMDYEALINLFTRALKVNLTTSEAIALENALDKQVKTIIFSEMLNGKLSEYKDGVPLTEFEAEIKKANIDLNNISSLIEVSIPPRPISGDLNGSINRQRALDQSA